MLSENRKYHYQGDLFIRRNKITKDLHLPKDDILNWLFMRLNDHRYGFIH